MDKPQLKSGVWIEDSDAFRASRADYEARVEEERRREALELKAEEERLARDAASVLRQTSVRPTEYESMQQLARDYIEQMPQDLDDAALKGHMNALLKKVFRDAPVWDRAFGPRQSEMTGRQLFDKVSTWASGGDGAVDALKSDELAAYDAAGDGEKTATIDRREGVPLFSRLKQKLKEGDAAARAESDLHQQVASEVLSYGYDYRKRGGEYVPTPEDLRIRAENEKRMKEAFGGKAPMFMDPAPVGMDFEEALAVAKSELPKAAVARVRSERRDDYRSKLERQSLLYWMEKNSFGKLSEASKSAVFAAVASGELSEDAYWAIPDAERPTALAAIGALRGETAPFHFGARETEFWRLYRNKATVAADKDFADRSLAEHGALVSHDLIRMVWGAGKLIPELLIDTYQAGYDIGEMGVAELVGGDTGKGLYGDIKRRHETNLALSRDLPDAASGLGKVGTGFGDNIGFGVVATVGRTGAKLSERGVKAAVTMVEKRVEAAAARKVEKTAVGVVEKKTAQAAAEAAEKAAAAAEKAAPRPFKWAGRRLAGAAEKHAAAEAAVNEAPREVQKQVGALRALDAAKAETAAAQKELQAAERALRGGNLPTGMTPAPEAAANYEKALAKLEKASRRQSAVQGQVNGYAEGAQSARATALWEDISAARAKYEAAARTVQRLEGGIKSAANVTENALWYMPFYKRHVDQAVQDGVPLPVAMKSAFVTMLLCGKLEKATFTRAFNPSLSPQTLTAESWRAIWDKMLRGEFRETGKLFGARMVHNLGHGLNAAVNVTAQSVADDLVVHLKKVYDESADIHGMVSWEAFRDAFTPTEAWIDTCCQTLDRSIPAFFGFAAASPAQMRFGAWRGARSAQAWNRAMYGGAAEAAAPWEAWSANLDEGLLAAAGNANRAVRTADAYWANVALERIKRVDHLRETAIKIWERGKDFDSTFAEIRDTLHLTDEQARKVTDWLSLRDATGGYMPGADKAVSGVEAEAKESAKKEGESVPAKTSETLQKALEAAARGNGLSVDNLMNETGVDRATAEVLLSVAQDYRLLRDATSESRAMYDALQRENAIRSPELLQREILAGTVSGAANVRKVADGVAFTLDIGGGRSREFGVVTDPAVTKGAMLQAAGERSALGVDYDALVDRARGGGYTNALFVDEAGNPVRWADLNPDQRLDFAQRHMAGISQRGGSVYMVNEDGSRAAIPVEDLVALVKGNADTFTLRHETAHSLYRVAKDYGYVTDEMERNFAHELGIDTAGARARELVDDGLGKMTERWRVQVEETIADGFADFASGLAAPTSPRLVNWYRKALSDVRTARAQGKKAPLFARVVGRLADMAVGPRPAWKRTAATTPASLDGVYRAMMLGDWSGIGAAALALTDARVRHEREAKELDRALKAERQEARRKIADRIRAEREAKRGLREKERAKNLKTEQERARANWIEAERRAKEEADFWEELEAEVERERHEAEEKARAELEARQRAELDALEEDAKTRGNAAEEDGPNGDEYGPDDAELETRFSVRAEEARRQYDEVVARYTNEDGTKKRGWMKAPNGQPTSLAERQWVQVRTPAFKSWFGDWEKSYYTKGWRNLRNVEDILSLPLADISAYAPLQDKEAIKSAFQSFGLVRNAADGIEVRFPAKAAGRFVFVRRYAAAFKELFETSLRAWNENETKFEGHKEHRNIEEYSHYVNRFRASDGEYFVRFTVRSGRESATEGKNLIHAANVSAVEIYKNEAAQTEYLDRSATSLDDGKKPNIDRKIAYFLSGVNPGNENSSKVVDANGEPLVVYRGAQFDPLAQEPGKGVVKPEAYFTADPEYAKRYGKVQAYYLNIRNPFDVRRPECLADLKKIYPNHNFARGKSGALDWGEAATVDGEFLRDNFGDKYDGVIYDEGGDPGVNGVSYRGISYAPLDGGAQVKSATDNNGDFSSRPDVRYSISGIYTGTAADYDITAIKDITDEVRYLHGEIQSDPSTSVTPHSVPHPSGGINPENEVARMRASLALPPEVARKFTVDELLAVAASAELARHSANKVSRQLAEARVAREAEARLKAIGDGRLDEQSIRARVDRILSEAKEGEASLRGVSGRAESKKLAAALQKHQLEMYRRSLDRAAREGSGAGAEGEGAEAELDRRIAKKAQDEVAAQTGIAANELETSYGIDLGRTLMLVRQIRLEEEDARRGEDGEKADEDAGEETDVAPPEDMVPDEEKAAREAEIRELVQKVAERAKGETEAAAAAREKARQEREENAAAEEALDGDGEGAGAGESVEETVARLALQKRLVNLENPEHFARFVAALAETKWKADHVIKSGDAYVWGDPVAMQHLRMTAMNVYNELARRLMYTHRRELAMRKIREIEESRGYVSCINAMAACGRTVAAGMIRETQEEMVSEIEQQLEQAFGAKGKFRQNEEVIHRKVTGLTELWARDVKKVLRLSGEKVAEMMDEILRRKDVTELEFAVNGRSADASRQFQKDVRMLSALQGFGALVHRSPGEISDARLRILDRLENDTVSAEAAAREKRTKEMSDLLSRAFDTGRVQAYDERTLGALFSRYAQGHLDFKNLLLDLMRHSRDEDARRAAEEFADNLQHEIQRRTDAAKTEVRRQLVEFRRAVERIYGRDAYAVIADLCRHDERFDRFGRGEVNEDTGAATMVKMSKASAMQLYVSLQQKGYIEGVKANNRQGQGAEIRALLSAEDLQLLKWMGDWYERERGAVSAVSESLFGLPVLAEEANYFPVKVLLPTQGPEKPSAVTWNPFPPALTPRVRHTHDFDVRMTVFDLWTQRMTEQAQWKQMAELGVELRGIFGRQSLQSTIRRCHGGNAVQGVLQFCTDILNGQYRDVVARGAVDVIDRVRGWAALAALGGNVGVMLKQTTSIPAFALEIGVGRTIGYLFTALTPGGWSAMADIWKSEQRRNRWDSGNSEEVANALNDRSPGAFKRLVAKSMVLNKFGDVVPALLVGQGIYRAYLRQGISREEAMNRTWEIVNRTQQTSQMDNQTAFQRRSSLGRAFFQFAGTVRQYLAYEIRDIRKLAARPDVAKNWVDFCRTTVLTCGVLPALYYLMDALWRTVKGKDPDDDVLTGLVSSCVSSPWTSLFFYGLIADGVVTTASTGKRPWGNSASVPALQFAENAATGLAEMGYDLAGMAYDALGGDAEKPPTLEDFLKSANRFLRGLSAPYRDVSDVVKYRGGDGQKKKKNDAKGRSGPKGKSGPKGRR